MRKDLKDTIEETKRILTHVLGEKRSVNKNHLGSAEVVIKTETNHFEI